jgi:hypothetical protein
VPEKTNAGKISIENNTSEPSDPGNKKTPWTGDAVHGVQSLFGGYMLIKPAERQRTQVMAAAACI